MTNQDSQLMKDITATLWGDQPEPLPPGASPKTRNPGSKNVSIYMFVVSGHLYRPLLLSQSWELGCKILGGFGTHPRTFFGAGLSILVFF